jgi:hypothetical protein
MMQHFAGCFYSKVFFYLKTKYLEKKNPNCISNITEKMVMTRDKQIFSELFIYTPLAFTKHDLHSDKT